MVMAELNFQSLTAWKLVTCTAATNAIDGTTSEFGILEPSRRSAIKITSSVHAPIVRSRTSGRLIRW